MVDFLKSARNSIDRSGNQSNFSCRGVLCVLEWVVEQTVFKYVKVIVLGVLVVVLGLLGVVGGKRTLELMKT